jgi:anti-anti-sigma regulatory factor
MWIENFADKSYVIYIAVSREPEVRRELEIINEIVCGRDDCSVVVSLENIEVLTSSSINKLVELHNMLSQHSRQLILCKVGLPTKGIFVTAGLTSLFNFGDDVFSSLATIQQSQRTEAAAEKAV